MLSAAEIGYANQFSNKSSRLHSIHKIRSRPRLSISGSGNYIHVFETQLTLQLANS